MQDMELFQNYDAVFKDASNETLQDIISVL